LRFALRFLTASLIPSLAAGQTDRDAWPTDPAPSRLVIAPTARALPRGDGHLQLVSLLIPIVHYGLSDRVTVSGGVHILDDGGGDNSWHLGAKWTVVERSGVAAAIGAMAFSSTVRSSREMVNVLYGVTTLGTADRAVSAGLGWRAMTSPDEPDGFNAAVVMFGADVRVSRRMKLMAEWEFGPGLEGFVAAGVRRIGNRVTWEFAVAGLVDRQPCCVPLINVIVAY
jgi:hypothetical protein